MSEKRKGWATPYGFVDFKEPVTYEEALLVSQALHAFWGNIFKPKDDEVDPLS